MSWDTQKLLEFKNHFGLTDIDISRAMGARVNTIFNIRNGLCNVERFEKKLDAYLRALKKAKKAEHLEMIRFYESFGK